mgnify:CR=1 FL=1
MTYFSSMQSRDRSSLALLMPGAASGLVAAVAAGFRSRETGSDTWYYSDYFVDALVCHCTDGRFEPGFQLLVRIATLLGDQPSTLLVLVCCVLWCLALLIARETSRAVTGPEMSRVHVWALVFAAIFASPFYVSANVNALRHGIAALLLALGALKAAQRQWRGALVCGLLAVCFHYSSILYLPALAVPLLPVAVVYSVTAVLMLVYSLGLSEPLVTWISSVTNIPIAEIVTSYSPGAEYSSGVRLDFVAFSLGLFAVCYFGRAARRDLTAYTVLCRMYLVLLWPFLVLGFGNFANRYAFAAWMFVSVLLGVRAAAWASVRIDARATIGAMLVASAVFVVAAFNGIAL